MPTLPKAPLDRRMDTLRALQVIPGVGPSLAHDLFVLGIRQVSDLKQKDPEKLYRRLEVHVGQKVDRCVLYVFREAVYFAKTPKPQPEQLKWWNWQDTSLTSAQTAFLRRTAKLS